MTNAIAANLDRQTHTWALLTLSDGRQFDCDGDNWTEIKDAAQDIAAHYGVNEIVFNSECPA